MCKGNSLDKNEKNDKRKRRRKKKEEEGTGCVRETPHIKKKPAWDV